MTTFPDKDMDKNNLDFQSIMEENSRLDSYLKNRCEQTDNEMRPRNDKYQNRLSSTTMEALDDEPSPLDLGD